jgi:hypothetical protein
MADGAEEIVERSALNERLPAVNSPVSTLWLKALSMGPNHTTGTTSYVGS